MRSIVLFLLLGLLTPTLSFSTASKEDRNLQKFNHTTLQDVLFSYPMNTFHSRFQGIVSPTIFKIGGSFSWKRKSSGEGSLVINSRTGIIDQFTSDPGTYEVLYKVGLQSQAITILVIE